jgi:DNA-binding NarL/FixJ family response regulator
VDQVMAAGASAFVLKQYAGSDLYDAIESMQKGHTYVSPSIQKKNKTH